MTKRKNAIEVPEGVREVLLHACCAPCSSAIVEWMLRNGIRPHIFYYNPNIWPREEYEIRKAESKRHADALGISWTDGDYDHDRWREEVLCIRSQGVKESRSQDNSNNHCEERECRLDSLTPCLPDSLENAPERGPRCLNCFRIRLTATALEARRTGINVFTTTLASSRWKSIEQITEAGHAAEVAVPGTRFWAQNWRKGGLYERRNQLLREYQFYNQQYCGCEFSLAARKKDE